VRIVDDGTGSNNVAQLTEGSDASIHRSLDLPFDAGALKFDYQFTRLGNGDVLEAVIGDDVLWSYNGTDYPGGSCNWSGPIDISAYAGSTVDLELRLKSGGSPDCQVWLDNIRVLAGQAVPLRSGRKAAFRDGNGEEVTVLLMGPGVGEVYLPPNGTGDAIAIALFGTKATSSLTISTSELGSRTAIGHVLVGGALASLTARTTDLMGGLDVTEGLGSLTLGGMSGGTIRIGGTAATKTAVTLKFGVVAETSVVSDMPIGSLTAIQWRETDGAPNTITAPRLGTLAIKGNKTHAGDFAANLNLTGLGVTGTTKTLSTATINGSVPGTTWNLTGPVGTVTVSGTVGEAAAPWQLTGPSTVGTLTLGDVANAQVTVSGGLGAVKAIRWLAGSIQATKAASITTTGAATAKPPVAGDFAANVTLSGVGVTGTAKALGGATIKGNVAPSTWDITGPVGALAVSGTVGAAGEAWVLKNSSTVASLTLGDVIDAEVQGAAAIGAVKAVRWQAGSINARTVASIATTGLKGKTPLDTLSGDFAAGVTLAGVPPVAGKKQPMTLGSMTVAGWLTDMTLGFTGPLGQLTMGGMRNADILAADPADATMSIAGLTIKGATGAAGEKWFINANVLANKLAAVAVAKVQTDNSANNPPAFGIKAHTIAAYTCDKMKHVAVGNLLDSDGDYTVELLP